MPRKRKKKVRKRVLTEQQKRFCQEYLVDLNATQAAIRSKYSKHSAGRTGHELTKNPLVKTAIEKGLEARAARMEVTVENVLADLQTIKQGALVDREWQAANRATELHGKHLGMFVTKHQVEVSLSLADMITATDADDEPEQLEAGDDPEPTE